MKSLAARGLVTAGGGVLLVGVLAGAASAHVSVSASSNVAGSYTVLTFSVPHGCDGSSTTQVKIQMPESINAVTPTVNQGWDVKKTMVKLATPVTDAHGAQITDRVSEVVYTAKTPLPADLRDTLALSLQLPEDAAGTTLAFPVVQVCQEGEAAWVQQPAEGQDAHSLDFPAPTVNVVAASGDEHGTPSASPSAEAPADPSTSPTTVAEAPVAASSNDSSKGLAVAGLITGVVGILVGGTALARRR